MSDQWTTDNAETKTDEVPVDGAVAELETGEAGETPAPETTDDAPVTTDEPTAEVAADQDVQGDAEPDVEDDSDADSSDADTDTTDPS